LPRKRQQAAAAPGPRTPRRVRRPTAHPCNGGHAGLLSRQGTRRPWHLRRPHRPPARACRGRSPSGSPRTRRPGRRRSPGRGD